MIDSLDLGLKGKVAIVAGGGAVGNGIGNGRAASFLLADAGVNVLVVDKDEVLANKSVFDTFSKKIIKKLGIIIYLFLKSRTA